jgi:hypothetical protein
MQGANSMALLGSCRPAGLAFHDCEWVEIKSRKVELGIPPLGKQQGATFGRLSKKGVRPQQGDALSINFGRVGRGKDYSFIIFKFLLQWTKI